MERIAIYYRVSTDKQDFDSQKATISKWLNDLPEEKRPKQVLEFMDEGISGKTTRRPGYQDMLTHAFGRKIDTIVVYRLDRLSRNATYAIKIILDLDEVGVAFVSVTQPVLNLGHENPFRRTMLAAFAEIAEIERETIVARVRSGLDAAKKRGVRLGPPIKINRELQMAARRLKDEGKSYSAIAETLDLSRATVHKMVTGEDLVESVVDKST